MTTISAYEAKTHLPRLLRAAERGETVIITRHGKPVAHLGPVQNRRGDDFLEVIERMKGHARGARKSLSKKYSRGGMRDTSTDERGPRFLSRRSLVLPG